MAARSKWLWALTAASTITAVLFFLAIFRVILALAVLAPTITGWPVFVLLAVGVALSLLGLRCASNSGLPIARRVANTINGCALACYLVVLLYLVFVFFVSPQERFIIPSGYQGDVYVIQSMPACQAASGTRWGVIYRIPEEGILCTSEPMSRGWTGWTRTKYFYQRGDGSLEPIQAMWPSTVSPTPENLANDTDFGIYFPRSGHVHNSECSVEYQLFYVGTKANLLTHYVRSDISLYLHQHQLGCSESSR
jgi:hypothetical protein